MEVALQKLRDQRGEIGLRAAVTLFVAVLLFLMVFDVRHAYQTADRVIDKTNEAVLAVAAANGPSASGGIREGSAVSRRHAGGNWQRLVTTTEVIGHLKASLGGEVQGSSIIRQGAFKAENIQTTYVNADGGALHFKTTMDLTVYLLGGDHLAITRTLEVLTTYEAKF